MSVGKAVGGYSVAQPLGQGTTWEVARSLGGSAQSLSAVRAQAHACPSLPCRHHVALSSGCAWLACAYCDHSFGGGFFWWTFEEALMDLRHALSKLQVTGLQGALCP